MKTIFSVIIALFLASIADAGILTFSWDAPAKNTDNSPIFAGEITGYELRCQDSPTGPVIITSISPTLLTYTFTGLANGAQKICTVVAVTAQTKSADSNQVTKPFFVTPETIPLR
jgi:hypothetical protein